MLDNKNKYKIYLTDLSPKKSQYGQEIWQLESRQQ